jgi:phospholipid/cholesterol/gamma-HCH transport system permease protein
MTPNGSQMRTSRDVSGEVSFSRAADGTLILRLAGAWRLHGGLQSHDAVLREVGADPSPPLVGFDTRDLGAWDSSLVSYLIDVMGLCRQQHIPVDSDGLPTGVRRLIALAAVVPERQGTRPDVVVRSWLGRFGLAVLEAREPVTKVVGFVGDITLALGRLVQRKARFRTSDLILLIQQAGADALGIVTLISFLVGTILAFGGAMQLEHFGAGIYVADLVGIAMVREMGAMMTGIVIAGRTGAAYAAQLGTMKVTQEIDALTTMGISPLDFLVLPRLIALCLMMPLLCLYADLVGVLGGAVVGIGMLNLSLPMYYHETVHAVHISDLAGGVCKASVYGILVAISGCLRGIQCGNSSAAVGQAATSAVVTGIVLIISACGMFALIFYMLGI